MFNGFLKPGVKEQIEKNHPGYLKELQELKDELALLRKERDELKNGNAVILAVKAKEAEALTAQANRLLNDAKEVDKKAKALLADVEKREKDLENNQNLLSESTQHNLNKLKEKQLDLEVREREISDRQRATDLLIKNLDFSRAEFDAHQKAFLIKVDEQNKLESRIYNDQKALQAQKDIVHTELEGIKIERATLASMKATTEQKQKDANEAIDRANEAEARANIALKQHTEAKEIYSNELTLLKAKHAQLDERIARIKSEEDRIQAENDKLNELKKYILKGA